MATEVKLVLGGILIGVTATMGCMVLSASSLWVTVSLARDLEFQAPAGAPGQMTAVEDRVPLSGAVGAEPGRKPVQGEME